MLQCFPCAPQHPQNIYANITYDQNITFMTRNGHW